MLYSQWYVAYKVNSEASYFADQTGVYEIAVASDTSHGNVMRQVCVCVCVCVFVHEV